MNQNSFVCSLAIAHQISITDIVIVVVVLVDDIAEDVSLDSISIECQNYAFVCVGFSASGLYSRRRRSEGVKRTTVRNVHVASK